MFIVYTMIPIMVKNVAKALTLGWAHLSCTW